MATANEVKQVFLDEYEHFGDQRIKKIENGKMFHVDDRSMKDYDAKKQLYSWFCAISAIVESGDKVIVRLGNSMPKNAAVEKWWQEHSTPGEYNIRGLELQPGSQGKLVELAELIESVLHEYYEVSAYKYVVPRTVKSLGRLKQVLDKAWAQ